MGYFKIKLLALGLFLGVSLNAQIYTLPYEDAAARDGFGRFRVSNQVTVYDAQFTYNIQPLLLDTITEGTGSAIAHDPTNSCAKITFTDTPSGGKSYMQTFKYFRYQPSKSQLVFITFNMHSSQAGVTKFAGYSDGENGIEFIVEDTTLKFKIFSATDEGDDQAAQSAWNIDPLDGTGPSGLTLDITKTQILVIDFQALYVGRVRVGFDIDGKVYYAHQFDHANISDYPYIQSANLPIRVGMEATATVTDSLRYICSAVASEGGVDDVTGFAFSTEGTVTAGNLTDTHILSIEPDSTFEGKVNRAEVILESIEVIAIGNQPIKWKLCLGQALTSVTRTDVNTTHSTMRTVAGTLSGTPEIVLAEGYVAATNQSKQSSTKSISKKYPITLDARGGIRDLGRLTVLVQGLGGTSDARCILNWREVR